jgi:conjugative relaxase-like TrwC/TraI family protein
MMSATVVSGGAASSGYYRAEGYYAADSEEAAAASQWFGKAAEELGLKGQVDDALFTSMLEGQTYEKGISGLQEGRQMGRMVDGERKVRPGLDLTFSAPKSLSVAALVFDDERLVAAHDKAVRTAMHYVETDLVQTRRSVNGEINVIDGGKVIAGLFRHDTSRAMDPQLHTHAVIANMIRNDDGKYTALHNDLVFQTQKLGSEIYRNALANEVRALGYEVERRGRDQLVEIKNVPSQLVEQFSKRRNEIEQALEGQGMADNARNAELAALGTRATKNREVDREALHAAWTKEAKDLGIDRAAMQAIVDQTKERAKFHIPGVTRDQMPSTDAAQALTQAIAHLSDYNVHYGEKDLLTYGLTFAKSSGLSEMQRAIQTATKSGELINVIVPGLKEPQFTDKDSLQHERDIAKLYRQDSKVIALKAHSYPMQGREIMERPETALNRRLSSSTLTDGQKDAVTTVMTGAGRVVGIQGYAGTGKTFALSYVVKEAERAGYHVEGVAPSAQAVTQLQDAIPDSETLQARLMRGGNKDRELDPQKTILVVDETSMVSNSQMRSLLQQAHDQKIARVVLVGDVQQLDGVGAGTPFALMQRLGMRTAVMADIQRQRNDDALAVVNHAIAGDVQAAFERLKDVRTHEAGVTQGAAQAYLALSATEREGTGLVTPSNAARQAINATIREGLKGEGALPLQDTTLNVLTPLRLSRAQIADPRSYEIGDVILAHQSVKAAGLQKGHQYEVVEIGSGQKHLMIRDRAGGDPLPFAPQQNSKAAGAVSVYEDGTRDFAQGDEIKFRIADKQNDIANGDTGRITRLDDETITVTTKEGVTKDIARGSLAATGLDHGYALTAHDFQGATVNKIIVAMSSTETMADQKAFYVAVSRARDDITLVTDDPERLAARLEAQTGQKITALEAYVATITEREMAASDAAKEADRETEKSREDGPQKERPETDDPERTHSTRSTPEKDDRTRDDDPEDFGRWDRIFNKERGDFER